MLLRGAGNPGLLRGGGRHRTTSPQPGDGRGNTLSVHSDLRLSRAVPTERQARLQGIRLFLGAMDAFLFLCAGEGGGIVPGAIVVYAPPGGGGCAVLRGRGSEPLSRSRRNTWVIAVYMYAT